MAQSPHVSLYKGHIIQCNRIPFTTCQHIKHTETEFHFLSLFCYDQKARNNKNTKNIHETLNLQKQQFTTNSMNLSQFSVIQAWIIIIEPLFLQFKHKVATMSDEFIRSQKGSKLRRRKIEEEESNQRRIGRTSPIYFRSSTTTNHLPEAQRRFTKFSFIFSLKSPISER